MLQGKTALITGASRGIGKAIAFKLADEGVNLILTGRSEGDLRKVSDEIRSKSAVKTKVIAADLLKEDAPAAILEKAIEKAKRIDFLINNAGAAFSLPMEKTSFERWNLLMNLNARAPFFLAKEAIPHLKASGSGVIINITAEAGYEGFLNQAAYAASKHALNGWTKALAKELKKEKIRVYLISPEGVDTDMANELQPELDKTSLINPDEIAEIALFLLKLKGNAAIDEIKINRSNIDHE